MHPARHSPSVCLRLSLGCMPEARHLVGLRAGALIAPAGHGKTEAIAKTAALGERTLVLTHTHAGVHALRGRLKRMGIPGNQAAVDTIDGWCMRYVRAFPKRGQPPDGMPTGAEWAALRQNVLSVLDVSTVREVVQSSYDRILIDEYQDCDAGQHALCIALSQLVPTIVFGDPMQGIFEFAGARLKWDLDVYPTFPLSIQLTEPRRWQNTNPELGAWIAETRQKLVLGQPIDLAAGPITFRQADAAFDMGAFFEGLGDRDGTVAAIHCRRGVCDNLAKATRGMYQSIEEVAAKRLTAFSASWDEAIDGRSRLKAILDLSGDCFHKKEAAAEEALSLEQQQVIDGMKALAKSLGDLGYAEAAHKVMQLARRHPRWRLFRGELWRDAERAMGELAAERAASLSDAVLRVRQRTSAMGRATQRRTISTPLLLKGLEFDHVLVPDASHFGRETQAQAKLFYVAISRATRSLTITAPDRYVRFPVPSL